MPEHQVASDSRSVVLYDGRCHLCRSSVRFLVRADKGRIYRLAWLQSPAARDLLHGVELPESDSVILVHRGRSYFRSTAILRALADLGGAWKAVAILLIIPRWLRDAVYDFVGARRYRWFGQSGTCELPDPDWLDRFVPDGAMVADPSHCSSARDIPRS